MAVDLAVEANSWTFPGGQFKTFADLELMTGAKLTTEAQQYLAALNSLRLASLFPLTPIVGGAAGANIGAFCGPAASYGIMYRGDAGYVRCTGAHTQGKLTASALASNFFVGCAGPTAQFIAHGTTAAAGTVQWIGDELTLPASQTFGTIGRPYDAVWSPYNGGRFVAVGFRTTISGSAIEYTQNSATNWTQATTLGGNRIVSRLAVGGTDGRYVLATLWENYTHNLVSVDGGVTFSSLAHNIAGTSTFKGCAYDDARQRWVLIRGATCYTASDLGTPTSWTSRGTVPGYSAADPATATGSSGLVCLPGGLLIAMLPHDSGLDEWNLSASIDGGTTWTSMARFSPHSDAVKGYGRPDRLIWSNGHLMIPFTTASDPVVMISRRLL